MDSIDGMVIFAQESRFQLLDRKGVAHHFIVGHACSAEPEQLPALQRNQSHVRVRYRAGENVLARVALRIDMLDAH